MLHVFQPGVHHTGKQRASLHNPYYGTRTKDIWNEINEILFKFLCALLLTP